MNSVTFDEVGVKNYAAVEFDFDRAAVHGYLLEVPLSGFTQIASMRGNHSISACHGIVAASSPGILFML